MPVFRWGQAWDPFHDLEREVDRLLASVSISFSGLRSDRKDIQAAIPLQRLILLVPPDATRPS